MTLEPGASFALHPAGGRVRRRHERCTHDVRGHGSGPSSRATGCCWPMGRSSCGSLPTRRRRRHGGRAWRDDPFAGRRQRAVGAADHARAHRRRTAPTSPSPSSSASTTSRSRSSGVRRTSRRCAALLGDRPPPIVAKIETRPAVDDFDAILEVVDAVMIARGDLGVELPYEEVPLIQKQLVRRALDRGVPTIVATQMLESMIEAPRPTRAEASDVAKPCSMAPTRSCSPGRRQSAAIPILAAEAAVRIARHVRGEGSRASCAGARRRSDTEVGALTSCRRRAGPRRTGRWPWHRRATRGAGGRPACLLSLRPPVPIFAFAPNESVVNQLALVHGVLARFCTSNDAAAGGLDLPRAAAA